MLQIHWQDRGDLDRFMNSIEDLSDGEIRVVGSRALNHVGRKARTQVRRALARQTGLPYRLMVRAIRENRSTVASLSYTLSSEGGDIALKYFKPRETPAGVVASPFGKRTLFKSTFMRGGAFPNRKDISRFGGHVMDRVSTGRYPVRVEKSGVIIPEQMVQDASAAAFLRAMDELPARFAHEVGFSRDLRIFTGGTSF